MAAEFGQHGASQNSRQVADPDPRKRQEIEGVIRKLVEVKYKRLHDEFKHDSEKSPDEGIEFVFHYACKYEKSSSNQMKLDFIQEVIEECLTLKEIEGSEVLKYLFERRNSDGYTPFHAAIETHGEDYLKEFLKSVFLKLSSDPASSIFVNAVDSEGWSPIHKILNKTPMLEVLRLVKEKIKWSAKLPGSNATALHLAIFYNSPAALDIILEDKSSDDKSSEGKSSYGKRIDDALNTIVKRSIVYGRKCQDGSKRSCEFWSPLQLAAMMGNADVVVPLLKKIDRIYDSSKRNNNLAKRPENYDDAIPALHLAAASGTGDLIRLFKTGVFDRTKLTSKNRTIIHFATDVTTPKFQSEVERRHENTGTGNSRFCDPFAAGEHVFSKTTSTTNLEDHEDRQACITLFMQDGVNIWQKDSEGTLATPGSKAPTKLRLWWYEARVRDALEAKKNLNDAASAISVVAALVATASYVGPLQPPLGYGTSDPSVLDLVQTTKLLIRVFVVTNCLSFYLAIGSILFAVVPSLPKPHLNVASMHGEWKRSKQTICIAMLFLLMSIVGVLVSFAAASNVGMEDHYSWQHSGLSFYPTILGSLICSCGIVAFFVRLFCLVFEKNVRIRHLQQK